jgi:hypothetical protein
MTSARAVRSTEAGFALVPALFLLVVLAALGLVAVRVGSGAQQAVTLAAANAGIEWGAYSALNNLGCASSTTLTLTEAALNGFSVVVTCTATGFAYGSGTSVAYAIKATASQGSYGQPNYVERVVSGTFTNATS